jgi:hypothetical protein
MDFNSSKLALTYCIWGRWLMSLSVGHGNCQTNWRCLNHTAIAIHWGSLSDGTISFSIESFSGKVIFWCFLSQSTGVRVWGEGGGGLPRHSKNSMPFKSACWNDIVLDIFLALPIEKISNRKTWYLLLGKFKLLSGLGRLLEPSNSPAKITTSNNWHNWF